MSVTNNKIMFIFEDSNEKEIVISITKVGAYNTTAEEKADDIAETILRNKACLNLDIVSLKKIEYISETTTDIIKDGEQV